MLNLCTTRDAARRAAAARAARGAGYETFLNLRVVVEPSEAEREAAVREATSYARVPAYTRQMQADGFDLDAVVAAGDLPAAMRAMPPGLVDELAVLGSAGECRARIDALAGTGVTPLLLPLGDAASLRRVVAALAP
jgi:alkanesulfonate monooxygenase SsuD/methylene tetrahydromethanopterin reductase-like flavin-dependent oxidoreductase (luciferase family)